MESDKKPSILIADDHPYTRFGMERQIRNAGIADAIYEAENGEEVLKLLAQHKIDVVLLDIKMPILDGFDTAPIIIERYPNTRVIMSSMFEEEALITNLVRMGVDGYILKSDANIIKAIQKTMEGQFYITPSLQEIYENAMVSTVSPKPIKLTQKEARLLPLLASGKNSREIADALMLTKNTVESYRKELLAKFGVNNCTELVNFAHRTGRL